MTNFEKLKNMSVDDLAKYLSMIAGRKKCDNRCLSTWKEWLNTEADESDDDIFLLSVNEYNKYKNNIPEWDGFWWLRSPGNFVDLATLVRGDGYINYNGLTVSNEFGVRPALKISKSDNLHIGDRIIRCDFPWIVIDDGLAIAEVPVAVKTFDDNKNDYEASKIRRFLLNWYMGRCE